MKRILLGLLLMITPLSCQNDDQNDEQIERITQTLINGTPIRDGSFKEVVLLSIGTTRCTGTVVGPRVVVTAAHCINNGQSATFSIDGVRFTGIGTRSSLFPARDHDIAVITLNNPITSVKFASIGGSFAIGKTITLLGFGCTQPGGGGGNDGILRKGDTTIIGSSGFDMISRRADGAALCFGDSGGPAFVFNDKGEHLLLGVNSKGNIRDTNFNLRNDLAETKAFLQVIASRGVEICGINLNCATDNPQPQPQPDCRSEYDALGKAYDTLGQCLFKQTSFLEE